MSAIEITNLKKVYQSKGKPMTALKDLSFTIRQGELFGLLGPNGAGKSTIINILGGVVNKTSGSVIVGGHDIDKDHRAAKMKLGIVPQEISFDGFLTVEEMMRLQFGYYGLKVDQKRIDDILKTLTLDDKRNSQPRWLSGGMKRRYMIARALVHDPDILILDEPTAGVDVELRHEMYDLIRKLHNQGKTIILTTHYLEEIELLAERVAIINKGELVALDDKQELKNRFESTREFKLALTEEPKEIPEVLKAFTTRLEKTTLVIEFEEADYKKVLAAVAKADLPVANFSIVEPTIEDVFLKLTN